jgi:hypothetical protein
MEIKMNGDKDDSLIKFTIKELLIDIKAEVKEIAIGLATKANQAEVVELKTKVEVMDKFLSPYYGQIQHLTELRDEKDLATNHRIKSLEAGAEAGKAVEVYRRWFIPVLTVAILGLLSSLLQLLHLLKVY